MPKSSKWHRRPRVVNLRLCTSDPRPLSPNAASVVAAGAEIAVAVVAIAVAVEEIAVAAVEIVVPEVVVDAHGLQGLRAKKDLMLNEQNVADIAKDTKERHVRRRTQWTVKMERAGDVAVTKKAELARATGARSPSLVSMVLRRRSKTASPSSNGKKDLAVSLVSVVSPASVVRGTAPGGTKRRSKSQ